MSIRRRGAILSIAVLATLSLFPPAVGQIRETGLIADGEPPGLLIVSTGDVIGYVDPCG